MGDKVYKMVCTKVEAGMICKNVSGLHTTKPERIKLEHLHNNQDK